MIKKQKFPGFSTIIPNHHPQSSISNPLSPILYLQSSISNPLSLILYLQSSISHPLSPIPYLLSPIPYPIRMYILITYDVSTITTAGKSRLRRTAKTCLDFGQRVQNSVFECKVDPAQLVSLRSKLLGIMDLTTDSLRIYHLGSNWHHKIEHHGAKDGYDVEGLLVV